MLTSSNPSNQYLRPDYLTPLPTTLDAKNSPLALLAQTCSAIGSDSPNPKLLANMEKSSKSHKSSIDSNRDKSSPISNQSSSSLSTGSTSDHQIIKSSFKPYESSMNVRDRSNLTPSDDQQQRSSSNLGANHNNNNNNNNHNVNNNLNNLNNNNSNHHNNNNNNLINSIRIKTPKSSSSLHNNNNNNNNNNNMNGQQQRCDSNQSATSQTRDMSPAIGNCGVTNLRKTPQHHNGDSQSPHNHHQHHQQQLQQQQQQQLQQQQQQQLQQQHLQLQQRSTSKDSGTASISHGSPNSSRTPHNEMPKDTTTKSSMLQNNNNNTIPTSSASYFPGYPPGLGGFPMDLITAGFMPHHHPMMKAAALNSYFNYARPKASDPATVAAMMPPVCRDPYCTGCPLSPHVMNKATGQPCPAGCNQCELPNTTASKSYQQHNNAAAAAYAHAQLAALAAASQLPYVCSWIAGDSAYCGKRFGTSDELFQHLRTHTASMPESMLNAVAASGLPPNHPLFQRTYPTPPLSPLSSARYHPYGKPSMYPPSLGPPSLAGLAMPQHPSLAPYFSPYSMYGPRLGSSPSMHP